MRVSDEERCRFCGFWHVTRERVCCSAAKYAAEVERELRQAEEYHAAAAAENLRLVTGIEAAIAYWRANGMGPLADDWQIFIEGGKLGVQAGS